MQRLGRIMGNLFAIALTVLSLQAIAESQLAGRDFNHMSTGFPLSGGHATAACETCHIGGVFKGTPKACEGCHALGKRIVATPKSSAHIVTDAPCETCHFNTATFIGARFNHANAQPGKCDTCHNGRISKSKPSSHNSGNKASKACDSCHRSVAWLPASWNHTGVATGTCSTCHISSPEVSIPNRKPASHATPALKGILECDSCHGFNTWLPAQFKHNTGAACSSCHNGSVAKGWPASHNSFIGWPIECNQCHLNTQSFAGALGAKPANHIPYNASVNCTACHASGIGNAVVTGAALHAHVSSTCTTCHLANNYLGRMQKLNGLHNPDKVANPGTDCSASGCHRPLGNQGVAYTKWN